MERTNWIEKQAKLYRKGTGIAFRTDILDKGLHTTGYDEIEMLQHDLKSILDN